jgi:hypothetical protein
LLVVVFAWQSLVIQGGLWGPPAPAPLTEEQCVETRKVLRDWGIDGVDEPQSVKADCNR